MQREQEAAPPPNHSLSTVDPTVSGLKAHPAPTHTHSLHTTSLIMSAGTPQSQSGVCSAAGCTHTHTHTHARRLTRSYLPQPSRRAAALIITQDTMRKNRAARRECESQRSLIVPCLACYHHFAAGEPERTAAAAAAAAPQRILGSVVLSAFLGEAGEERKEGQVSDVFCREGREYI